MLNISALRDIQICYWKRFSILPGHYAKFSRCEEHADMVAAYSRRGRKVCWISPLNAYWAAGLSKF